MLTSAQAVRQVPLESVISTRELSLRPRRAPNAEALSAALVSLARTMSTAPQRILQDLVEVALTLCCAQSSGISLLEEEDNELIFRWHGVAGQLAPHLWGTTPRGFSPCGTVLDTNSVQLMTRPDRHFTYFAEVDLPIEEALLIPFHVGGEAVGTLWVVSHDGTRRFDAEDARVMTVLGEFASAAYQALSSTQVLKSIFATIQQPLLILDRRLRIQSASRSFYQTFALTPDLVEKCALSQLGNGEWNVPELLERLTDLSHSAGAFENLKVTREFSSLGRRSMMVSARKLDVEENLGGLILLTVTDATDREIPEEERVFRPDDLPRQSKRPGTDTRSEARHDNKELIGNGKVMNDLLAQVHMVAPTNATVLILGETGTGKELIARALHRSSHRWNAPFVTLNCAAIPTGLLESELFGYERGAFTGALHQKLGRFELANQGTLFLDEVGDIPLELQPKLLRALQEKSFERLGGTKTIPIDVRLLAATNRNLGQMMRDKLFRSDLYYRLMVFPIITPPLRDRPDDIAILSRFFTKKFAAAMNRTIDRISPETMRALERWRWPGNVRELENFIERSVILSKGPTLQAPISELFTGLDSRLDFSLDEVERDQILRVLRETGGVISATAKVLDLPRTTLNAKMKKLGISRADLRT